MSDVKKLLLGHWGTTPGQNFIYTHLNRVINEYDANMIYISGPGHGGPALMSNVYLEGTFGEIRSEFSRDEEGMKQLFKKSSFPGGLSSHVSPTGTWFDPRGWRTRLLGQPCVWCCF
jgi:xylulose-5-phosphate/fructose-6-phosphate phosphoketolase